MSDCTHSTLFAQRRALARKFAPGLVRPFSGMNISVRLGEIAQTILSRWPIRCQRGKPAANLCYLAVIDRAHWLMLRESLFSLYRSWNSLPELTVVSDGSWNADELRGSFCPVACANQSPDASRNLHGGFQCRFSRVSRLRAPKPLRPSKLTAMVIMAVQSPVLFCHLADILWFRDPALLLGPRDSWDKPRALRESNCHQRQGMAMRHCAAVLEPPFVNSGIVALHGELMTPDVSGEWCKTHCGIRWTAHVSKPSLLPPKTRRRIIPGEAKPRGVR